MVNPQDVCELPAASTPPSIDHTVDEIKPLNEFKSFIPTAMLRTSSNSDYSSYPEPEDRFWNLTGVRWDHEKSITDEGPPSRWTSSSWGPNTRLESRASSPIPLQSSLAIVVNDEVPHQEYFSSDNGFESLDFDFDARKCLEYFPQQDDTLSGLNISSA